MKLVNYSGHNILQSWKFIKGGMFQTWHAGLVPHLRLADYSGVYLAARALAVYTDTWISFDQCYQTQLDSVAS